MDCTFDTERGRFNYRAAGVFLWEGRLLAMKEDDIDHYYLPGGRVRLHETAAEALSREIGEELGTAVTVVRPLWLCESFFSLGENPIHEMALYYLAGLDWEALPSLRESFRMRDSDGCEHQFVWLEPEELRRTRIYPLVLKECFPELPAVLTLVTDTRDRQENLQNIYK